MSSWSHGYNTSLGYTYHYFRELSPAWLEFALRLAGHQPLERKPGRYLDLGCGQGYNLLLHAAAFPDTEFLGIDFNPLHIAHARELAERCGIANVRFEEADFLALAQDWPADYGQFDHVVLHGIYSWVGPRLRQAIVQCLTHAVRSGGIVYNSYNTLPGCYAGAALQHLLRRHEKASGLKPAAAIDQGMDMMHRLNAAGALLFPAQPRLMPRMEENRGQNKAYLIQEYLHDAWHPFWHGQVVEELRAAKLDYVGTATLPEAWLPQLLTPAMRDEIAAHDDPLLQQELIDACINQSFRRDCFQRGVIKARPVPQSDYWYNLRIVAIKPPRENYTFSTAFGDISGQPEGYEAVMQALHASGPQSLGELHALPHFAAEPFASLIRAASFLLHGGYVSLWRQGDPDRARRVNRAIAQAVAEGAPYTVLTAAHSALATTTSTIDLLLLDAWAENESRHAGDLAADLMLRLARLDLHLSKDNENITDPDAIRQEAVRLAERFIDRRLPQWRQLGVW